MCVVSMVMDHYSERWRPLVPNAPTRIPVISREEVDEFYRILERAREYDRRNHEPDCEMQDKKDTILALAKKLGVEINFVEEEDGIF